MHNQYSLPQLHTFESIRWHYHSHTAAHRRTSATIDLVPIRSTAYWVKAQWPWPMRPPARRASLGCSRCSCGRPPPKNWSGWAFEQEYRALSRLRHRNIVRAYETGEVDGYLYTALERIDGETLDEFLLRAKKIGEAPAIGIVRQVASALDYLHAEGYVHRDVKPANILMARDGRAVLFDFGTVLNLNDPPPEDTIGVYGTPAFLAPEQINNTAVDGRADLYALGHHPLPHGQRTQALLRRSFRSAGCPSQPDAAAALRVCPRLAGSGAGHPQEHRKRIPTTVTRPATN